MLLEGKNAIVYGAAGGIGSGVSLNFAAEGARVFLVGRTGKKLEQVALQIAAAGGSAEVCELDAANEQAVNDHVRDVAARAGSLDVSINLISHGDTDAGGYVQGRPMTDISAEDFFRPMVKGLRSNYITAQAAARQMVKQGSGVILTLTNAGSSGSFPMMGSTGTVAAAIETFARNLASEVGPSGVRVLGVKIGGIPELFPEEIHTEVFEKESGGLNREAITAALAQMTLLKRATTLADVVNGITFLASEKAAGMTASFTNITGGMVVE